MLTTYRNGTDLPAVAPVNRLGSVFDRLFNDEFFAPLTTANSWAVVPMSLWQDEHALYIEADMPGLADKDIDVSVHDGNLIIRGERKCERRGSFDNRRYGQFEQRVALPCDVDADQVEAKLASGVLWLRLPKSEQAKPRKIAIQAS